MRKVGIVCVVAVFALSLAACGRNKEADQAKKAAEEAQKAAEQAAKAAESGGGSVQEMAKGMEQFAKSMEQLQKGADGKSYEPVSFKSLQEVLPAIDGWEKGETEGETMSSPVKFSQATTSYSKGDARIEVKVVDTAMSQLLTMPYQMFLLANYSKESSKGYEKATKIGGYPGWEKWDSEAKRAELGVLVGQRFLVTADGNDVESAKAVQDVVSKMDLGKLAGLK